MILAISVSDAIPDGMGSMARRSDRSNPADPGDLTYPGLDRAVRFLEHRFRPAAILLFGSRAAGCCRETSDYDLGMIGAPNRPDAFAIAAARTDIEDTLGSVADLVLLDETSPILRMEILRNHRILAVAGPEQLEEFIVRSLREYFDLKRIRKPIEEAILAGART